MKLNKSTFLHCIFCGNKCLVNYFIDDNFHSLKIKINCDSCNEEFSCVRNTSFFLIRNRIKNNSNKEIFDCVFGSPKEVEKEQAFLRQQKFIKENGIEVFEKIGNVEIAEPKIFWS